MTKIAVVALGGNALTRAGQSGSYDEMMANAAAMATAVNDVLEAGWRVVVVHGNGPQVGNLAMQQEAALQQEATAAVPAQPLALLGAMTQGMLGSVLARAIDLLRGRGTAAALVTHVTVDPADPAFGAPSKPIGPFFEPAEAERLARRGGWVVKGAAAGSRCWPRTRAGSWTRSSTRTGPPASSPGNSAPRPCSWSPRWTG